MATRGPIAQIPVPTQLCDFCHQKPKFSNHQYCSKTCATQAASLCKYCQKKPKFQNFDYCGKNCAALAAASVVRPQVGAVVNPTQQQQALPAKAAGTNASTKAKSFNPIQVAKLVAQHIPQVQNAMNGASSAPATQPAGQAANAGATAAQPTLSNNPFMNVTNQQQPQQAIPNGAPGQAAAATQAPLECLIPGCGKPVHVDAQGSTTSDYCSRKHREEAVQLGLASPCIMCLTMPQSDVDYFCGKACRDEALNKI